MVFKMTQNMSTNSVFDAFMSSAPQAPNDMASRMRAAAKMHETTASFRDNTPDVTGQHSNQGAQIKHRHSLYSTRNFS